MKKYFSILLLFVHGLYLSAQKGQAILGGVVLDQITEDTIYWARINVYDQNDQWITGVRTYQGQYRIADLSPGVYNLRCFVFNQYHTKVIRNVVLKEGFTNWYPRMEHDTNDYHFTIPIEDDYLFSDMEWEDEYDYEEPSLYPNPAHDYFSISAADYFSQAKIYDLNGRLVQELSREQFQKVAIPNLNTGFYVCVLEAPQWSYSYGLKFIKY